MRSQLVRPALAYVQARGGDADAVARAFGLALDVEHESEVTMPLSAFRSLLDRAAEEACDPLLGARLALELPRGTYGIVEYASRTAPTLREAIWRLTRYIALLNELVTITLKDCDGESSVRQEVIGAPDALGRHANEFFVVFAAQKAREMTEQPLQPLRVRLAHAAPANAVADELRRLLGDGTPILEFGTCTNTVSWRTEQLDTPMKASDPPLLALLERQAEQALATRDVSQGRFLGDVRRRIAESLGDETPDLDDVAVALRMSRRTLQRKLADEGASFQGLLDGVREELARTYVLQERPLADVAFALGYRDFSAFSRAFRRWTGLTPSAYRARNKEK